MEQKFKHIQLKFKGPVCFVMWNDTDTKNAISFEIAEDLYRLLNGTPKKLSVLEKAMQKNNCGCVVFSSAKNGVFASGGNLKQLAKSDVKSTDRYTHFMNIVCARIHEIIFPTIALLKGPSFGGGTELALAADERWVIGTHASFHFWQAKWNVPGGWGGMKRLDHFDSYDARKTGITIAQSKSLEVADLLRYGIVERVFISEDACKVQLEAMAKDFLNCEESLRLALLHRKSDLNADKKMFSRFWMKGHHKKKLSEFVRKLK